MQKFKIGEKVYPISKTVEGYKPLDRCRHWKKAKEEGRPYLYVVNYTSDGEGMYVYGCNFDGGCMSGNYFMESDLVQYDKYMRQFKEGVKVKLISGGGKYPLLGFNDGERYIVKGVYSDEEKPGIIISDKSGFEGYALPHQLEIVQGKISNKKRIDALELKVAELSKELEALKTASAPHGRKEEQIIRSGIINGNKLETADKTYTPSIGDIVVITGNTNNSRNKVGDIGKVVCFDGEDYRVEVPQRLNNGLSYANWTKPTEMRKATSSEVEKYEKALPTTANKQRAEIIEKAKEFIEEYQAVRAGDDSPREGNRTCQQYYYETEFIVKGNKVTALIRWLSCGKTVQKKVQHVGRAFCSPTDVFNEHIGKAIALGRALELDVSEFEQAVQPKDFVKGQLVNYANSKLLEVDHVRENQISGKAVYFAGGTWMHAYELKIINDTNAQYGG